MAKIVIIVTIEKNNPLSEEVLIEVIENGDVLEAANGMKADYLERIEILKKFSTYRLEAFGKRWVAADNQGQKTTHSLPPCLSAEEAIAAVQDRFQDTDDLIIYEYTCAA